MVTVLPLVILDLVQLFFTIAEVMSDTADWILQEGLRDELELLLVLGLEELVLMRLLLLVLIHFLEVKMLRVII